MLCDRQLSAQLLNADPALIRACAIASRFGGNETGAREPVGRMRAHFQDKTEFRSDAFWAELAFMDEITPASDDWHRYYNAEHQSLIGHLTQADRSWLEAAVADETRPERRAVALYALLRTWHQSGRSAPEREMLRAMLKGDARRSSRCRRVRHLGAERLCPFHS